MSADAAPAGANNDHLRLAPITAQQIAAADPTAAPSSLRPLWLPRTRSDWDAIAEAVHVSARQSSKAIRSPLEEITVTAPAELLPMADVYDEMWGGILAPVWAVLHPTQAWRIFLPIPPE